MNKKEFINYLIDVGEINREVISKSMEVSDFPLARKLVLKIEGHIENILHPKNLAELELAKGELLLHCIVNNKEIKQEGIKFVEEIVNAVSFKNKFKTSKRSPSKPQIPKINKLVENKKTIDAGEVASNVVDNYSIKKAEYFFNRGINKWHSHVVYKNKEILNDLNTAIIMDPENPLYLCKRGGLKIAIDFRGNYIEEAFEDLNKAILLNQNIAESYFLRGFANYLDYFISKSYHGLEDLSKGNGLEDFRKGMRLEPNLQINQIVKKYLYLFKGSLHKDAILRIYDDFSTIRNSPFVSWSRRF